MSSHRRAGLLERLAARLFPMPEVPPPLPPLPPLRAEQAPEIRRHFETTPLGTRIEVAPPPPHTEVEQ